jgi:hypothetical protein
MPYVIMRDADYPGTGLPVYKVYDAEEYNDVSRTPRPIGEVWLTGIKGVTGDYMPTGVRWQLAGTGMLSASEEMPYTSIDAVSKAAREMIGQYESSWIWD